MSRLAIKSDWMLIQSILLLLGLSFDYLCSSIIFCPVVGFFLFLGFVLVNWPEFTLKKSWGGLPNWVTLSRLLLVIIAPFFCDYTLAIGILALSIVLLDGVDGFLARKLNQITPFGAQLDMETDAFFCLVFSLLISINHPELSWVLIAGSMRYTYKIITSIIAKNGFQESKKKYARYSAGVYFFSLLLFFFMDGTLAKTVLIVGNGLVLVSFSISFYEYFKFNK